LYLKHVKWDELRGKFSNEQLDEICIKAIRKSPMVLQYIENQTEEMCLIAVKKDGLALKDVDNQTEKICLEAMNENPLSFYSIRRKEVKFTKKNLLKMYIKLIKYKLF
ncbi:MULTISPECIES: DUF4116 domain-containing protein, partial [unclassified Clostridioides]|nr:DUF4116 domain-containing protein [Clostridioides sp. ES-S-0145-01]MCC0705423.1 DUF4116 domain-containing protein [Clostridioides sp. ES-S-0190-01]